MGDNILAYQCFKLAVTNDNNHTEAYNNLGVLEWYNDRKEQVCLNNNTLLLCVTLLQYRPSPVLISVRESHHVVMNLTTTLLY